MTSIFFLQIVYQQLTIILIFLLNARKHLYVAVLML